MPDISESLRSATGLNGFPGTPDILTRPARDLLGVSESAAQALDELGIRTVFDLGASNLFATARAVVETARSGAAAGRFGLVAGDLLDPEAVSDSPEEMADLPLDRLRPLSDDQATKLATALDVATISDLAHWPPHREARKLVGDLAGVTLDPEEEPAEELRPRFGQYPTERVYYNTLVMLQMLGDGGPQEDLTGSISLAAAVDNPAGMNRPAVGALLTFEQSWFAQGVTLGHLLHSLSLAPGEATRIAVIDWSRRTSAFSSETIGETEQLDSATTHARALSEVQEAVASDFQEGGSKTSSRATSTSESEQSAGSSGLLTSLFSSGSGSSTSQSATTRASGESSSWSLGNRSVMGSLTQNVNDRTEQHSASVRNRRASAVREVAQSEHENISTRIVANYNHMHALNLQYYEVVQVYRTEARLHRADRCLFIPMEMLDFSGDQGFRIVERFRGALLAAALNERIRALLEDDTTAVEIAPVKTVHFPGVRPDLILNPALGTFRAEAAALRAARLGRIGSIRSLASLSPAEDAAGAAIGAAAGATGGAAGAAIGAAAGATAGAAGAAQPLILTAPGVRFWDADAVARVARFIGRAPVRVDSTSLFVPDETELIGISFDQVSVKTVRVDHAGTTEDLTLTVPADSGHIDLSPGARFVELDAIHLTKTADAAAKGSMTLHCAYLGRRFTLPNIPLDLAAGTAPQRVVEFRTDQADRRRELQQHLQSQREHYSQAIFRSLDAATLTFILGRFRLNGRPLIDQVEPRPVTVAGNYLVLRAPVNDDEFSGLTVDGAEVTWAELLDLRGLDRQRAIDRRLISIPTGGVFAEAVLGRSNSAEKLDLTRFWHWQDSPIPIQPTEIAPIQAGSRGTAENLTPGQLSQPVLNIVSPTPLPEPTGMGAVLNALTAMNFRDMSGLAGLQEIVKASEAGTLDAATAAGKIASENLKTEAQKAVQMGQIAGDIAKAAIAADVAKTQAKAQGGGGGGMSGISREGALVNHAKKIDEGGGSSVAPGGGGGASTSNGGTPDAAEADFGGGFGGALTNGDGAEGGSGSPGRLSDGLESETFKTVLHGTGASPVVGVVSDLLLAKNEPAKAPGATGGGEPARPPFPDAFPGPLSWVDIDPFRRAFRLAVLKTEEPARKAVYDAHGALKPAASIPLIMVSLEGGKPSFAGQNVFQMHYSGSLLKAAAMFAAFQLRKAVFDFAATLPAGKTEAQVIAEFRKKFDTAILSAATRIPSGHRAVPKFADILTVTPDATGYKVEFRATGDKGRRDFAHHLERMIVDSHNTSAGVCIQNMGFSWLNGALLAAGFIVDNMPANAEGIWLAGDYLYSVPFINANHTRDQDAAEQKAMSISGLTPITVKSLNDGPSKQATTCVDMANLMVQVALNSLIKGDADANTKIRDLLTRSAHSGQAQSVIKRFGAPTKFDVILGKIGVGTLGTTGSCLTTPTRDCVVSEAMLIEEKAAPKRKFVVVYQNIVDGGNRSNMDYVRIKDILEETIAAL